MNLSHSALEAWESCELAWAMDHVYKMPAAPNEHFILGHSFHKALEEDGKAKLAGAQLSLLQLTNIAENALHVEMEHDDPEHHLSSDNLLDRLHAMLLAYVEKIQSRYEPVAQPERKLKLRVGDDFFVGVIDAQSARAIMDWKTANSLFKWGNGAQHEKAQATAYLMLLQEGKLLDEDGHMSDAPVGDAPAQVTFIVFAVDPKHPEKCEVVALPTTREAVHILDYKARISRTAAQIKYARSSGVFHAMPNPNCRWCGYLGSCAIGLKLYGGDARVPLIYPSPDQLKKLREMPDPDPDAPEACETCQTRGKVLSHIEVCARPASKSFSSYAFVCETCGVKWNVTVNDDGVHRTTEEEQRLLEMGVQA